MTQITTSATVLGPLHSDHSFSTSPIPMQDALCLPAVSAWEFPTWQPISAGEFPTWQPADYVSMGIPCMAAYFSRGVPYMEAYFSRGIPYMEALRLCQHGGSLHGGLPTMSAWRFPTWQPAISAWGFPAW